MPDLTHVVRNSLIDNERTSRLGENALDWHGNEASGQLAYGVIDKVNLISYPSFGGDQGQCTLCSSTGSKIKLRSHHYLSLGNFENRSSTYEPFVRELCSRVASANSNARFISGSTAMWFVYLALVLVLAISAALIVKFSMENLKLPGGIAGALLTLAIFAPGIWRLMRKGPSRNFDPENPPAV